MAKREKQESKQSRGNILANPEERRKFKTTLATITNYFQMIDQHRESIKETIGDLSEHTGLDKKTIRKMAVTLFKHNYSTLQEENEHFAMLYETLVEGKLTVVSNDEQDRLAA